MNKIDEQFIKEKVNPVVGFIFHTARQLGQDNAPASMDMQYLKQGTEKVCELLREASPTAPPAESVEDAKVLAKEFYEKRFPDFPTSDDYTFQILAEFAEQYATKQIERQTPAIIERFVEEVNKEAGVNFQDDPYNIPNFQAAMRAVKARRSGGEGK